MRRPLILIASLLLLAGPAARAQIGPPVLKDQPAAPTRNLKLVRVGGGIEAGAVEYFDETSITHANGHAGVWRLYVLATPHNIGRMMTQAVWVLSDFDCKEQTVAGQSASILGLGMNLIAHGSPSLGERLFNGAVADAITADEACDGKTAPGERLTTLAAAVRDARSTKD